MCLGRWGWSGFVRFFSPPPRFAHPWRLGADKHDDDQLLTYAAVIPELVVPLPHSSLELGAALVSSSSFFAPVHMLMYCNNALTGLYYQGRMERTRREEGRKKGEARAKGFSARSCEGRRFVSAKGIAVLMLWEVREADELISYTPTARSRSAELRLRNSRARFGSLHFSLFATPLLVVFQQSLFLVALSLPSPLSLSSQVQHLSLRVLAHESKESTSLLNGPR